jgi:hypothetical protein
MAIFRLHNPDAATASYSFVSDAGNAFAQLGTTPNAPSGCRGPNSAYNRIVITNISIDVGGYDSAGVIHYGVWSSSGTSNYYASSNGQSIGQVGATSDVPTPTSHTVPVADRFALSGNTTYYFGLHNSGGGGMTVERTSNLSTGQNVAVDESHASPGADLSGTGWQPTFRTNTSMIGTYTYIHLPSKPLTPAATSGGKNRTTVSWTAPADDGDSAITGYLLSWKKSSDSVWTSGPSTTSLSYTITGLEANTTYNVRVAATNAAAAAITYDNVNNVHSDYSDVVNATTAPGGPPVWTGTSWAPSETFVCTSNGTWTGAAAASVFVCTNATPGSVVWTPIS